MTAAKHLMVARDGAIINGQPTKTHVKLSKKKRVGVIV